MTGEPPRPGNRAVLDSLVLLLATLSALHQFHRQALVAVEKPFRASLGIDEVQFGDLGAVFFATYTLAMIGGGWLADRIGTKRTLASVAIGSAGASLALGSLGWLSLGAPTLLLAAALIRGGLGLAAAPLYPSTSRSIGTFYSPGLQPLANGVVTAAAPLGIAAAFPLLGASSERWGWAPALAVAGAASLPVALGWALWGRGTTPDGGNGAASALPARELLLRRGLLPLALGYLAVGYYEYVLMGWFGYYLREVRQVKDQASWWMNAAPNIAMMLFAPLGGLLVGRLSRSMPFRSAVRIVPMVSLGLAGLLLAASAQVESVELVVLLASLGMGFMGASEGPFWTAAVHLGRHRGALAAGIMNTAGNVPGILASVVAPRIARLAGDGTGAAEGASRGGWTISLVATGAVAIAGLFTWLWVDVDPEGGQTPS